MSLTYKYIGSVSIVNFIFFISSSFISVPVIVTVAGVVQVKMSFLPYFITLKSVDTMAVAFCIELPPII